MKSGNFEKKLREGNRYTSNRIRIKEKHLNTRKLKETVYKLNKINKLKKIEESDEIKSNILINAHYTI